MEEFQCYVARALYQARLGRLGLARSKPYVRFTVSVNRDKAGEPISNLT